jgi:cytochrome oxidase Cu insertion factor (SCO1/SenC/PrrC family)
MRDIADPRPHCAGALLLAALIAVVGHGNRTVALQRGGQPNASVDVQKLGPQIGEHVPDFSLPDQRGETHSLQSLMGPKGVILVFFRSADW